MTVIPSPPFDVLLGCFYVLSEKGLKRLNDEVETENLRDKRSDDQFVELVLGQNVRWANQGYKVPFTLRYYDRGRGPRLSDLWECPQRIIRALTGGEGDVRATFMPERTFKTYEAREDEREYLT